MMPLPMRSGGKASPCMLHFPGGSWVELGLGEHRPVKADVLAADVAAAADADARISCAVPGW